MTTSNPNTSLRIEQLMQLTSCTLDRDLISKVDRDALVRIGLVNSGYGWNWISNRGVEYLVNLCLLRPL